MKSLVLVVLLAAAATAAVLDNNLYEVVELPDGGQLVEILYATDEQELTGITDRRNLAVGTISGTVSIDREVRANGIPNRITVVNLPVTLPLNRRITAVRATRIGASQNAAPAIVSGGVGLNHVTVRITSAISRGFRYRVQVYAR